jgi:hypothetical protein
MTMMVAMLRPPEVVLKQDCPIAWPIDDAIFPTDPAQEQLEWIRSRYHQTLFLPEVSRLALSEPSDKLPLET